SMHDFDHEWWPLVLNIWTRFSYKNHSNGNSWKAFACRLTKHNYSSVQIERYNNSLDHTHTLEESEVLKCSNAVRKLVEEEAVKNYSPPTINGFEIYERREIVKVEISKRTEAEKALENCRSIVNKLMERARNAYWRVEDEGSPEEKLKFIKNLKVEKVTRLFLKKIFETWNGTNLRLTELILALKPETNNFKLNWHTYWKRIKKLKGVKLLKTFATRRPDIYSSNSCIVCNTSTSKTQNHLAECSYYKTTWQNIEKADIQEKRRLWIKGLTSIGSFDTIKNFLNSSKMSAYTIELAVQ
ncbi:6662_t:CDS:2, partial [Gigaspora margarita]